MSSLSPKKKTAQTVPSGGEALPPKLLSRGCRSLDCFHPATVLRISLSCTPLERAFHAPSLPVNDLPLSAAKTSFVSPGMKNSATGTTALAATAPVHKHYPFWIGGELDWGLGERATGS